MTDCPTWIALLDSGDAAGQLRHVRGLLLDMIQRQEDEDVREVIEAVFGEVAERIDVLDLMTAEQQ